MSTLQKIPRVFPEAEENAKLDQADFSLNVIEAIPLPVAFVDKNNRYEYVNKAYLEWRGVNRSEVVGKNVDEFLGQVVYALVKDHVQKALNGHASTYEIEIPFGTSYRQ